jgi:hypothetical protein
MHLMADGDSMSPFSLYFIDLDTVIGGKKLKINARGRLSKDSLGH